MRTNRGVLSLPNNATYDEMISPVGILTIITSSEGLHAILWDTDREKNHCREMMSCLTQASDEPLLLKTKLQLTEYFQQKRREFDLPLVFEGTDFQIQAWQQLMKIPFGSTMTYAEQAAHLGDKKKARAVGMANSLNPLSIVIPCHRVVGVKGHLVGFAGGVDKKAYLLNLESNEKIK